MRRRGQRCSAEVTAVREVGPRVASPTQSCDPLQIIFVTERQLTSREPNLHLCITETRRGRSGHVTRGTFECTCTAGDTPLIRSVITSLIQRQIFTCRFHCRLSVTPDTKGARARAEDVCTARTRRVPRGSHMLHAARCGDSLND